MIYLPTNQRQHESILILTHKKIGNVKYSFRFYKGSAILNRLLAFPINLVWKELCIFKYILCMYVLNGCTTIRRKPFCGYGDW